MARSENERSFDNDGDPYRYRRESGHNNMSTRKKWAIGVLVVATSLFAADRAIGEETTCVEVGPGSTTWDRGAAAARELRDEGVGGITDLRMVIDPLAAEVTETGRIEPGTEVCATENGLLSILGPDIEVVPPGN